MAGHISQADVLTQAVILELKARLREQDKQLREEEKKIKRLEKLSNVRYSDIRIIVIAFSATLTGAGITLGILAAAGW